MITSMACGLSRTVRYRGDWRTAAGGVRIGLRTTTGISAERRVIKSASDVAVGNSTISTGVGKRVSHWEDIESELEDWTDVEPDRIKWVIFRGRERRRSEFSVLDEKSPSSRAVTRSNASRSECTPCTVGGARRHR